MACIPKFENKVQNENYENANLEKNLSKVKQTRWSEALHDIKGAAEFCFTYYMYVVIILFITDLYTSAFSTYSFKNTFCVCSVSFLWFFLSSNSYYRSFLQEPAKLRALRAKNVLACQHPLRAYVITCQRAYLVTCERALRAYVLTCQRVLIAYVPTCFACLRAHVPTCPACLCVQVPTCLVCLRAHVPCERTCSSANVLCVFKCSRANVSCVLTCSSANVP